MVTCVEDKRVWDGIEGRAFRDDAAIEVRSEGRSFAYTNSWQAIHETAATVWTDQGEAL